MLVVADQRAMRIGGERGFAGAGEAEEDRRVAVLADIGRAMHRHDLFLRQQVIEDGEHRFLHLARIARAADEHDLALEVASDDRLASRAMPLGVGAERGQIDDRQFRDKAGSSSAGGRIRRLRMKSECQAYSVKTRARMRNAGSAPP